MSTNKKRLKIALIHPDLGIGGAERLVLDVASALKEQNHEILFLTNHFDKSHAFEELKNNEFPVEVYGDWLPRSVFGLFQALCAYIRMIYLTVIYVLFYAKNYKADLYFVDLIPIAIPILKFAKQKVIYYCHHPDLLASAPGGFWKRLYRKPIDWIEEQATQRADLILVNSKYTAKIFKLTFQGIEQSIHILYPTVARSYIEDVNNVKVVKPINELVPQIQEMEKPFVFLSINRYHPAKNLELAINAMARLQVITNESEWQKFYCIIAGGYDPINKTNYDTLKHLIHLVQINNLQNKIIFLKSPSDKLKVGLMKSCSALLYTPLKEHFGIVPLEAMFSSLPVIAVDDGGPQEVVVPGVSGYLCKGTAESMAEDMYKLFKEDCAAMGARGKLIVEEKFSYKSFSQNLELYIDECLSNKKTQ